MKKIISILSVFLLVAFVLSCKKNSSPAAPVEPTMANSTTTVSITPTRTFFAGTATSTATCTQTSSVVITATCTATNTQTTVETAEDTATPSATAVIFTATATATSTATMEPHWQDAGGPVGSAGYTGNYSLKEYGGRIFLSYVDKYDTGSPLPLVKVLDSGVWQDSYNSGLKGYVYDGSLYSCASGLYWLPEYNNDDTNDDTVMKFNGSAWTNITLSPVNNTKYAIAAGNGNIYTASVDNINSSTLAVRMFGTDWNDITPAPAVQGMIADYDNAALEVFGGELYMAVHDPNVNGTVVKKYNGAAWDVVGQSPVQSGHTWFHSLKTDGVNLYLCFADDTFPHVYKFNGSIWVDLNSAGIAESYYDNYPSLAVYNGTPYIALRDAGNSFKTIVKKYDGVNWVLVGAGGLTPGDSDFFSLCVTAAGVPYLAYSDNSASGDTKPHVIKFE